MTYPEEALVFRLKNDVNGTGMTPGEIVEFTGWSDDGLGNGETIWCGPALKRGPSMWPMSWPGWYVSPENLHPLTPAARDLLAVARGER